MFIQEAIFNNYDTETKRDFMVYENRVKKHRYTFLQDLPERIDEPSAAAAVFKQFLEDQDREHFAALLLDRRGKIIGYHTVSIGSLSSSVVHPRETFKMAILASASSIILGHNHPSGDVTPSQEDIGVTNRLIEAGKILGIEVLDHVIIGDGHFSFKEKGMM